MSCCAAAGLASLEHRTSTMNAASDHFRAEGRTLFRVTVTPRLGCHGPDPAIRRDARRRMEPPIGCEKRRYFAASASCRQQQKRSALRRWELQPEHIAPAASSTNDYGPVRLAGNSFSRNPASAGTTVRFMTSGAFGAGPGPCQGREGKMPWSAMMKFTHRYGDSVGTGALLPARPTVTAAVTARAFIVLVPSGSAA
jgi:hypothetical protein